jgi:pSer/pThr/pTyr-binding forkhead associated (FHA) protein
MDIPSQGSLELTAFVQLCLNGKVLEEYEIRSPVISIGRSPECDITIDNAAISWRHALLSQRDGKLFVEDASSTNGVLVNGARKQTVELALGESIQIAGKYSLSLINAPTGIPTGVSSKEAVHDDVQKETVLVDAATLSKLVQNAKSGYLTLSSPDRATWICRLDKPSTSIGRKRSCEIRVGGWFAPATVATIERHADGYYLKVAPGREVALDGQVVTGEHLLRDGSRLRIVELSGVFRARANGLPGTLSKTA